MQTQRWRSGLMVALTLLCTWGFTAPALAGTSSSAHYQVDQTEFSAGSTVHNCSSNYCSNSTLGDTTVGSAKSANYGAQFGYDTTDVPLLEVIVNGGEQDLGVFGTGSTATATAVIKVRSYLSNGYGVQITGNPPSQGQHALQPLTTPTTSHAGAEQFGINLVANTSPSVGSDPVQVPSGTFSHGTVTDNYNTSNLFMYQNGDQVAVSDTSTGETDYTMSMIFNIANSTPAGHYTGSLAAVVVADY